MILTVIRNGFNFSKNTSTLLTQSCKPRSYSKPINLIQRQQQQQKRLIFTTLKNQVIPPIIWLWVKPLSKLSAIVFGRVFRKWWAALPKAKRDVFIGHLNRNKHRYLLSIGGSTLGVFGFYQMHLEKTPITGRTRFVIFNSAQLSDVEKIEKELIFEKYKDKILGLNSSYVHRTLNVSNRLFNANKEIPEVKVVNWKLTVIDAKITNAFAFPSGDVVVFTGLLDFVENDDELSIIMAHEMSHAILQHAAEEYSQERFLDLIKIGMILIIWSIIPSDILSFITQQIAEAFLKIRLDLPHSRLLESEADQVGLQLAAKACFDVRYSPRFWKRMSEIENKDESTQLPELLSTHPASEKRAIDLESLMDNALQLRKDCKCYELPKEMKAYK